MQPRAHHPREHFACGHDTPSGAHYHLHSLYTDPECCAAHQCLCPAPPACDASTVHSIVFAERRPPSMIDGLALLELPRDVLRYVLGPYLGALDRHVLRATCRALAGLYEKPVLTEAHRFALWRDACASAPDVRLLEWLHAHVPASHKTDQAYWLCTCAALRDQCALLKWLAQHGLLIECVWSTLDDIILASAGCTQTLAYVYAQRTAHMITYPMQPYTVRLACAAARFGRLETLRWLYTKDASSMDNTVLAEARLYKHTACVTQLLLYLAENRVTALV